MTLLHARTNAEAHLYMDLRPCPCGDLEFDRQSAVITVGEALCSRYTGPCRSCGAAREFVFELPDAIRPIRGDGVDFGGSDPSRLLDPGEWLAVAEYFARLEPGTADDLDIAAAAVAEVLKFVPADGERVPDDAVRTERGRTVRDREPGRFRRPRLEAVLGAYRDLLARHRPPPPARPEPSPAPAPAPAIDELPPQELADALARALARRHGYEGDELRRQVSDLQGQLHSLARRFQIKAEEDRQRRQTIAAVERLLDGIAQTGTAAGDAIAAHRAAIAQAFRGLDLTRLSEGMQALVAWLRDPAAANRAPIEQLIAQLESAVGATLGAVIESATGGRGATG